MRAPKVDDTDRRIMACLRSNSRVAYKVIAHEVRAIREVDFLAICTGSFNLSGSVVCLSHEHLLETAVRIQGLDGVEEVDVRMHLRVLKSSLEW